MSFTPLLYVRIIHSDDEVTLHGPFEGTLRLQPFLNNLPPDLTYELFSNVESIGGEYFNELESYQLLAQDWKEEAERRPVPSTIEELQVP